MVAGLRFGEQMRWLEIKKQSLHIFAQMTFVTGQLCLHLIKLANFCSARAWHNKPS
jgi:hypothetical protein